MISAIISLRVGCCLLLLTKHYSSPRTGTVLYTYRYTSWMTLKQRQLIYSRIHYNERPVIRPRPCSFSFDTLIFDRLGFALKITLFPNAGGFHSAYIYTGNGTQTNILPCEFILLESKNNKYK